MALGFYNEMEERLADGMEDVGFGFLENVRVGEAYNLYDFLHGNCDDFAAALSDCFGYQIEYVLGSGGMLIHAYCVQELADGELAYIDARGMTTDEELFFDEFRDWCDYDEDAGVLHDVKGLCKVVRCKDTNEMYSGADWERTVDGELRDFLMDFIEYYDVKVLEMEQEKTREKVGMLQQFEAGILEQLQENGVDVSQMEVHVLQFIDEKHQDCLWFGGQVASVEYKGFLFSLEARGDVIGSLLDEKNNVIDYVRDKNNLGYFFGQMGDNLADDEALHAALRDGSLVLENNNWFEIFVMGPDGIWLDETWVSNSDGLGESLVEMVETMDDLLSELGLREKPLEAKLEDAHGKAAGEKDTVIGEREKGLF